MNAETRINTAMHLVSSALQEIEACQRELLLAKEKRREEKGSGSEDPGHEYSIAEFCRLEGISRSTLFQWWKEGRGPRRRVYGPRRIRIAESDVQEWRRSTVS